MSKWNTVAIVGVGLIGGSIGLALKKRRLAQQVVGVGRRAASLRKAKQCGAVDATTTNLSRGVAEAELIVVCTPVDKIVEHVRAVARDCPAGALITDAGSTKAQIVAELSSDLGRGVNFIGSHPLAGSEKTGPEHARDDLFENRNVIVTPGRRSVKKHGATVKSFWKSLGANVLEMTPAAHDAAVASISHLPHLVASALAGATPTKNIPLAAGGWLDTTRIAAGDVELWTQILSGNRDHVLKSLGKFEKVLASFKAALEKNDHTKIAKLFKTGKQNRDAVGS